MESNVVSFIVENIFLFLPLGLAGIIITLYLYFTSKREGIEEKDDLNSDYLKLSRFNVNVYVLIYLFIFIMMIIIGLFSNFILPVIAGGSIALIPIIMVIFVKFLTNHSKVL